MDTKPSDKKIDNEILWRAIKSIHSKPGLREWVTLESQALKPIYTDANLMGPKTYLIHMLLTIPNNVRDKSVFMPPWGYVCWHWPSMRLMAMINISGLWDKNQSPNLSQYTVCTHHYANSIQDAIENNLNNIDLDSDDLTAYYEQLLRIVQPIYKFSKNQAEAIKKNKDNKISVDNQVVESEQINPPGGATFNSTSRVYELLPSHMTAARNLIFECGQKALLGEWQRIFVAMNQPIFSVAVVGEFSSGKSTLINKLLNKELLPVGNLPTTSKLTRIIYGPEPVISYMDTDRKVKHIPFDIERCEELIVNKQDSGLNSFVQVEIPHEWFSHTGIQLIDTPGVNEITGQRALLVNEAIASCDATLVVINATSPLSLTERHFVEQHIFLRQIPRVAVVLTNLDRIKGAERSSLISFLKEKISEWSTDIFLWCSNEESYDLPKSDLLLAGAKEIRDALTKWARDDQNLELRGIQYTAQLYALLLSLKNSVLLQKKLLALSETEQQDRIKAEKGYIEHCHLDWNDLRIALSNRCLSVVKKAEFELRDFKTDILHNLKAGLLQTGDPKVWWKEVMPVMLRNQFKNRINSMNISLRYKIIEDAKWLDAQINAKFTQHLEDVKPGSVIEIEDNNSLQGNETPLADLNKYRNVIKIGTILSTIIGLLASNMILPIVLGGRLIGEKFLNNSLQKQKEELNVLLEMLISEQIEGNINYAVSRIKKNYDNLIKETKLIESTWAASNLSALDINIVSPVEATEFTSRINKIDQLLSDLRIWIGGNVREEYNVF